MSRCEEEKSPIIFYQYRDTTDLDFFRQELVKRFRGTGHTREIRFHVWNCYDDLPGKEADLLAYDAASLTALVDGGIIRQLPEIIDTSDVFSWVLDTGLRRGKVYGIPFLVCFDALICRREDDRPHISREELQGNLVTPLLSMIRPYYAHYLVNHQSAEGREKGAVEGLLRLRDHIGSRDQVEHSRLAEDFGLQDFISGKKKYLLGFSEMLSLLPKGDYAIRRFQFTSAGREEIPLLYADFASIGAHVREEKLLDCIDLLEILCSAEFQYAICAPGGVPSFMVPPTHGACKRLMALDPLYEQIYRIAADPANCTLRGGADYYQAGAGMEKALIDQVLEK